MAIYPCARGASECSMCSVEMPWHWSGLCEHCRKETPCRKCGEILKEYVNVEMCIDCYRTELCVKCGKHGRVYIDSELCALCYQSEPAKFWSIPKRRTVCLPKSQ